MQLIGLAILLEIRKVKCDRQYHIEATNHIQKKSNTILNTQVRKTPMSGAACHHFGRIDATGTT